MRWGDTSNFSNIAINIKFINILITATAQYKILLIDRIIWTNYVYFIYHCWCWKLSKFWRTSVLGAARRCMVQHMQKITDYRHFIVFRGPLGGEENFLQLLGLDRPGPAFFSRFFDNSKSFFSTRILRTNILFSWHLTSFCLMMFCVTVTKYVVCNMSRDRVSRVKSCVTLWRQWQMCGPGWQSVCL